MLSGGIQENMIKTFETHPPGCAYPLSVHRQSRPRRLAKRLDARRSGTAGSTIQFTRASDSRIRSLFSAYARQAGHGFGVLLPRERYPW